MPSSPVCQASSVTATITERSVAAAGTNFSFEERWEKRLHGLLPPSIETLQLQSERCISGSTPAETGLLLLSFPFGL